MDLVELERARGARHPWERARLAFFRGLLRREGLAGPGASILDVGSGDAWIARAIADAGLAARVTCWDTGYTPEVRARLGLEDGPRLSFLAERPRGRFDLLLLLDVLEHVDDDAGLLRTLVAENLAPGGRVLASVPAWPALYGAHDAWLRHHRRYRPAALRALAEGAGLRVVASGGLFHSLLLPRALTVLRERLGRGGDPAGAAGWSAPAPVTAAVDAALAADTALTRLLLPLRLSLPGLSAWVLCKSSHS